MKRITETTHDELMADVAREVHMISLMVDILRELFDVEHFPAGVADYDDFARRLLAKDCSLDLHAPGVARAIQTWSAEVSNSGETK